MLINRKAQPWDWFRAFLQLASGSTTAPVCHSGTNMQHIFTARSLLSGAWYGGFTVVDWIELNHPICVTEHLFQLQKRTCGHHSKSRITTAIDSQCLFEGAIWLVYCECFCPDTHLHGQNTHCAHHKINFSTAKLVKLGFLHPTNCIVLYVPA